MKKIVCIWIVVFLSVVLAEAGEIYKWVDEKGVTHYSNIPPPAQKDEEVETVKEEKGVSKVGTPATPPSQTQSPATATPTTTPSPAQVDIWVDAYGNQHPITPELIAQETARLKERLHYYEYDCKDDYKGIGSDSSAFKDRSSFAMQAKDRHRKWCEDSAESVKRELQELAKSPKMYFYKKGQTKNKIVNPYTGEEIPFAGGVGSYGNYYIRTDRGYINTTNNEFIPIK